MGMHIKVEFNTRGRQNIHDYFNKKFSNCRRGIKCVRSGGRSFPLFLLKLKRYLLTRYINRT